MASARRILLRSSLVIVIAALAVLPTGIVRGGSAPSAPLAAVPAPVVAPGPASTIRVAPGFAPGVAVETLGPLPAGAALDIAVGLAPRDPAGLAALIASRETPGSISFHRFLTAPVAAATYGAQPSGLRAAISYFRGFGLDVRANPDGLLLDVSGPAAAIARSLGTSFEEYRAPDGRLFFSHPTPASLPSIAPWSGVLGLDNRSGPTPAVRTAPPSAAPVPSASCAGSSGGLLPCAIEAAYNMSDLLARGVNGTGYRVAVVDAYSGQDQQPQLASDLRTFELANGLPTTGVSFLYPVPSSVSLNTSSTNPQWGLEDSLDIEWARAVAPGASLEMAFSPNSGSGLYEAVDWLVAHDAADAISMSWGEPELGTYNAYAGACVAACNASTDGTFSILAPVLELGAAEGISIFAASGDCGAADGTSGVATNFPASDPYVTGIGGTVVALRNTTPGAWLGETGWGGNSSGASSPGCQNQGGSGGGYSVIARPAWQVGLPAGTQGRGVPDVAIDARTPVQIEYIGSPTSVIGTSVGTPIWAGISLLADDYAGGDLGLLDPSLYRILSNATEYAADFHDITTGNNGYAAGTGWDPVTGIGTPRVDALVTDLAAGGALAGGNLAVALSGTPLAGATPLTTNFTVTPSGGSGSYPVYGVAFGDGTAALVTTGTVTHSYAQGGVYTAQAFAFDSAGNSTVSPPVVVVAGGGSALAVTLSASTRTPSEAVAVNFTAAVTGGTGPYLYNFSFGDGAFTTNGTAATVGHAYCVPGSFDAYVVVRDAAHPENGGVSAAVAVTVANATGAACAARPSPLILTPATNVSVRDAPADFPSLFSLRGGRGTPTLSLSSGDPYTAACNCSIFENPGNYTVDATATDSSGRSANATVAVTVAPSLVGTFSASTLAGPVPLTVNLSVLAAGGYGASPSAAAWSAGDGATATGATARFTYSVPGEYLAVGRLADRGYGNTSEAFLIDAEPATGPLPLGVTGTIAPAEGIASGTTVAFSATLVGGNASDLLRWTLGDGHDAYGSHANETYFASGLPSGDVLAARLSVVGTGATVLLGVPLSLSPFFAVEAGNFVPAADALTAGATLAPSIGPVPFDVRGLATAAGPGTPALAWAFGDGGTAGGALASYSYVRPGNFTAVASATDPPFADVAVVSSAVAAEPPIVVRGSLSAYGGVAPLSVSGVANASGGVGPPYTFVWSFANASSASGGSAGHTFSSPGRYLVRVTVTDAANESGTLAWNVSVSSAWGYPVLVLIVGAVAGAVLAVVLGLGWRARRRRRATP